MLVAWITAISQKMATNALIYQKTLKVFVKILFTRIILFFVLFFLIYKLFSTFFLT